MPQADIIQVADAVVAVLNNHAFSQAFAAERACLPVVELQDLDELKVAVVPKEDEGKLDMRSLNLTSSSRPRQPSFSANRSVPVK